MPYDVPGFGIDRTPPTHSITPDLALLNVAYSSVHVNHFPSTLPRTIAARAQNLSVSIWGATSGVFAIFALLGLFTLTGPTLFAVSSAVMLFATYLLYATPASWTLYYLESIPAWSISPPQAWRGRRRWPGARGVPMRDVRLAIAALVAATRGRRARHRIGGCGRSEADA